jgi:hypothetical protein
VAIAIGRMMAQYEEGSSTYTMLNTTYAASDGEMY